MIVPCMMMSGRQNKCDSLRFQLELATDLVVEQHMFHSLPKIVKWGNLQGFKIRIRNGRDAEIHDTALHKTVSNNILL